MKERHLLRGIFWGMVILSAAAILFVPTNHGALSYGILKTPIPAPEFTHRKSSEWLNSPALTLDDLEGKVVLLDFWTFECWNCYRSFPWLRSVEAKFHEKGLQVIGVHSPEFEHERDINRVREKLVEFELAHPVMIDNDFSYWRALQNRYWPAFYVLDKRGRIRGIFIGETHAGDKNAQAMEGLIEYLLGED